MRVSNACRKVLSEANKHTSTRSESIRRLLIASFAHQQNNIVHGTMAAYLVRNKTRYLFSHETVYCPHRDIERILRGQTVGATVHYSEKHLIYSVQH